MLDKPQQEKPHKGTLSFWVKRGIGPLYFYEGIFDDHPSFKGTFGHTSLVVKQEGNEIETLNSRYTLGEPMPPNWVWDHKGMKHD